MKVGMFQLLQHGRQLTRYRFTPHIYCWLLVVERQQILCKAYGEGQLATSLRTTEHDGMWQTTFVGHLHQTLLRLLLPYHLLKNHFLCKIS